MKAYIAGIAYYLPKPLETNEGNFLCKKTGILYRHICPAEHTAADMAFLAAEKLFAQGVARDNVDFLLLCTQSPDYFLPSTACILQDRLHLRCHCGALDFNLGCSGYVYGLGLAKGLIESGQASNVLLLTAETYSKHINPRDHAVRPLFGDAATATWIAGKESEISGIRSMVYGTDGSGAEHLIVPVGGMRKRHDKTPLQETVDAYGNVRTNRDIRMNGGAIMDFTIRVVPEVVQTILAREGLRKEEVDYYVFHQANRFMLERLQKRCGLMEFPYWNDVKNYGNTVSNSLPIALADLMHRERETQLQQVMLVGFGVGLSWGGCMADLSMAAQQGDEGLSVD